MADSPFFAPFFALCTFCLVVVASEEREKGTEEVVGRVFSNGRIMNGIEFLSFPIPFPLIRCARLNVKA